MTLGSFGAGSVVSTVAPWEQMLHLLICCFDCAVFHLASAITVRYSNIVLFLQIQLAARADLCVRYTKCKVMGFHFVLGVCYYYRSVYYFKSEESLFFVKYVACFLSYIILCCSVHFFLSSPCNIHVTKMEEIALSQIFFSYK